MVAKAIEREVEPGSELDRLLDEAAGAPLTLIKGARRYTVVPQPLVTIADSDDIWANYDPEAVREGIRRTAGSWKGLVDAEELKAYIRERRLTKNRPPIQW